MSRVHPRSILWPMVLIGLGLLWLLGSFGVISFNNLWLLAQLWPVLLIAAGLILIFRHRWPLVGDLIAVVAVALIVLAVIFAPRLGFAAPAAGWFGLFPFMWGGTAGSGQVVTETREVSGFNGVSFSAVGDLTIQSGAAESLSLEAEDNIVPEFRTEVRGGTLYIEFKERDGLLRVRPTRPIKLNLTVKNLTGLELSGAGNIVVNQLKTDQLRADLSGAGGMRLDGLDAGQLRSSLSGAGGLTASGKAAQTSLDLSGVGSFHGDDLQSASANINISGTGSATLWVTDHLDANISGLGSVRYYGQPVVSQNVSGLGSIKSLGSK